MSFAAAVLPFQTGTGAIGTTISLAPALGGLTPKVLIATMISRTELVDASGAADLVWSRGWAVSTSSRRCVGAQSAGGISPTSADGTWRNDCLLTALSTVGASAGKLDVNSLGANSAQLIIDEQFTVNRSGFILFLAGTDIANATIIDASITSGTGNLDITTVGHPGIYYEIFSPSVATVNTIAASPRITIGRCTITPLVNQVLGFVSIDNVSTTDTAHYCNDLECSGLITTTTAIQGRNQIVASLSNGFTVNRIEALGGTRLHPTLILNGTFQVALGNFLSSNSIPAEIVTALGFDPLGGELWSHLGTESTQDTMQAGGELSIGPWQGPMSAVVQGAVGWNDPDNLATSAGASAIRYADAYVNMDGTGAVQGAGQLGFGSGTANALTYLQTVADDAAHFIMFSAFSGAPVVGGSTALRDMIGRHQPIPWPR